MKKDFSNAGETYFRFSWLNDGNEIPNPKSEVPPTNFEPEIPNLKRSFKRAATNSEQLVKQNKELQEQLILARSELVEQRENVRKIN